MATVADRLEQIATLLQGTVADVARLEAEALGAEVPQDRLAVVLFLAQRVGADLARLAPAAQRLEHAPATQIAKVQPAAVERRGRAKALTPEQRDELFRWYREEGLTAPQALERAKKRRWGLKRATAYNMRAQALA